MSTREYDNAIDLTRLPLLTKRRVCLLADCSPWTVDRSPLVSVGKRGRSKVYKTEDVLRWIAGELEGRPANTNAAAPRMRAPGVSTDALARLEEIRRGRQP